MVKLMTPEELQAFVEDHTRAHYDDYVRDRDRAMKKAMADVVAEIRKREAQWMKQEVEGFFARFFAELDRSRDRLLQQWRSDSIAPGLHQGPASGD